jgi:DNA topoisomerase II
MEQIETKIEMETKLNRTDKYKKKEEIDHVLTRPDMYVGSIRQKKSLEYIAVPVTINDETATESCFQIVQKEIIVSPAFVRIFVEVLSNAVDNVTESLKEGVPCTKIKVEINPETGETSVLNDGLCIPIEKKDGDFIHTIIFGQFRTSGNYDDEKEREVSGRNGYGVKLANIFSTSFTVKGVDPIVKKSFTQEWKNNMKVVCDPIVKDSKLILGSTKVSFIPDFEKFGMTGYTEDVLQLFYKYVIDVSMLTGVSVYLNGKLLRYNSLLKYSNLYFPEKEKEIINFKYKNSEIVITTSSSFSTNFLSFANGVYTSKGGKHVDAWSEAFFRPLVNKLNKKDKPQLTIRDVKQFFTLFIKTTVINPVFESQSKHSLEGPDVEVEVTTKILNTILKWSVINKIKSIVESKEILSLKKTEVKTRSFQRIEGYDRANNSSNPRYSKDCILILCEGKSAKQYAIWGIEVGVYGKEGRDWFGIYPVRGKLLNVRRCSTASISKNTIITGLTNALGLKYGLDYTIEKNFETLRYGKLMLLTDADVDGIHISGLVINYIHKLFPTLIDRPDPFIVEMCTPVAKIRKGVSSLTFYDERNYNEFMENNRNNFTKKDYKYYKGLGTSTSVEVEETFGQKIVEYKKDENTDFTLNKVFADKFQDMRKQWLEEYDPSFYKTISKDEKISEMSISDFYDNYMIQYSIADCARNIPNLMDGLKESQRKILYCCFKRNLKSEVKVAQLAGYVSEHSNYHHGEDSLNGSITHMASCFVGGNNVPLLKRNGMFGSRLEGGKDAASPRYIFTLLEQMTRCLFPEQDDILLKRVIDDGDVVEPVYYPCIIPFILANPCNAGIGTGWSSTIPAFNPLQLCDCVEFWIENFGDVWDTEGNTYFPELIPWYRGFKGTIIPDERSGRFLSSGIIERTSEYPGKLTITELPIGTWITDFKEFIEDLLENKKIKSVKNYSTPTTVYFEITEIDGGIVCDVNTLKLSSFLHTTNLVAFTEKERIKRFDNVYEIIDEFCKVRFEYYIKRKEHLLGEWKRQLSRLNNKKRFIQEIIDDTLLIFREEDEVVNQRIEDRKFDKDEKNSFDYLLSIQAKSFTKKKIEELEKEIEKIERDISELENTEEKELWKNDINSFRKEYSKFLIEIEKEVYKKVKIQKKKLSQRK